MAMVLSPMIHSSWTLQPCEREGYADQPGIATRPAPVDALAPAPKVPTKAKARAKPKARTRAKANAGLTPAEVAAGKKERKLAGIAKGVATRKRNAAAKAAQTGGAVSSKGKKGTLSKVKTKWSTSFPQRPFPYVSSIDYTIALYRPLPNKQKLSNLVIESFFDPSNAGNARGWSIRNIQEYVQNRPR